MCQLIYKFGEQDKISIISVIYYLAQHAFFKIFISKVDSTILLHNIFSYCKIVWSSKLLWIYILTRLKSLLLIYSKFSSFFRNKYSCVFIFSLGRTLKAIFMHDSSSLIIYYLIFNISYFNNRKFNNRKFGFWLNPNGKAGNTQKYNYHLYFKESWWEFFQKDPWDTGSNYRCPFCVCIGRHA